MIGWDVVTSDGGKIGHVVGEQGEYLIVEHGTLRHVKHAVPKTYATPIEDEKVCVSISKETMHDSPKLNGDFPEQAVAEYWGLAPAGEDPPTEGYGDVVSDADPSWTADQGAASAGLEPAEQERAEIREGHRDYDEPDSPALLGERTRDT